MKNQREYNLSGQSFSSPARTKERRSPMSGSHGVTLTQSSNKRESKVQQPDISTEVHLTVRISNSSLTRKHFRLMLECLLYEIVHEGVNLERYLMMEHLMSLLLGVKTEPLDLNNEHERRLCLLSQVIMRSLRGYEFSSISQPLEYLPEEISQEIVLNDFLMSERTYKSRRVYWKPEKYLKILSVSVDTLIERSGNTERYSSYCKGYGESHPSAHYKKTPPSFELDGEDAKDRPDLNLIEICKLLILNQLDIRLRFRKKN